MAAPIKALQASGRRELTYPAENRSGGCRKGWPCSNCTAPAGQSGPSAALTAVDALLALADSNVNALRTRALVRPGVAMNESTIITHIGRPAGDVFTAITDVARTPVWTPGLTGAHQTSQGPVRPGTTLVYEGTFLGRRSPRPLSAPA